ncbi:hypothetical protein B0H12DRAFT_1168632 [Mycena haematopus]|nr:hypothetical protein B0H12DRAFT_1168632 [Mycena haematopus]
MLGQFQSYYISGGQGGNGGEGGSLGGGGGAGNGPTMQYQINTDLMTMNLYMGGLDLSANSSLLGNFLQSYLGDDGIRSSPNPRSSRRRHEGDDSRESQDDRIQHIQREKAQARKKKAIAVQNRLGRKPRRYEVPKKRKITCRHKNENLTKALKINFPADNDNIPPTVSKSRRQGNISSQTILVTLCVLTAGVFVVQLTVLTVAVTLRWPLRQHR